MINSLHPLNMTKLNLKENIERVRERIVNACDKVGRKVEELKLIAVTKQVSPEIINEAIELGITDIGENRVQEILKKIDLINHQAKIHMIGHLQTNKAKQIIGKVETIQSIDSLKIANEINKRAQEKNLVVKGLIQIHTAKEETKFGLNPEELEVFLEKASYFKNVLFEGLMTIGTFTDDEKEIRRCFTLLRDLLDTFRSYNSGNIQLKELSMGMSSDFELAIEEGSTIVRIGTAIFGERKYN